ncbi:MAG: hypothetical protein LT082_08940 [Comamonas sp.]|nr:hypothetical protein [Comamonas sp.]
MAVKISGVKPTVTCPAALYLPDDGGKFYVHRFEVVFRRLGAEERDRLHEHYTKGIVPAAQAQGGEQATQERQFLTTPELLDEIVEGWAGMLDERGAPVPYSAAERRATEQVYPGLEQAMAVSWYENFFTHQREAARKNSEAQSATTSGATTHAGA